MADFHSLTKSLELLFDSRLADLPTDLRQRVDEVFKFRPSWDILSAEQRRSVTIQSDFEEDPACEEGRRRIFELYAEIAETEAKACPTVLDLEAKERRLAEREAQIDTLDAGLQSEAFARWGLVQASPSTPSSTSVRGERACQRELETVMLGHPSPEKPKEAYRAEYCEKHNISRRGFDRAWSNAITATGNSRWGRAGRPAENPST